MEISLSAKDADEQSFSALPILSTDAGETWSKDVSQIWAPTSNPAGAWGLSARTDRVDLSAGTTYVFAVGYESLGADYTATDSRCHLGVTIVSPAASVSTTGSGGS